jgi:hypothetical protein
MDARISRTRRGDPLLVAATTLYAVGLASHTADHVRRGTAVLSPEVFWLGIVSTIVSVLTIALIAARHPWGQTLAALIGLPVAAGVAVVHLLPHWSVLSDAFPGARGTGVTAMSWTVVLLEIAGAAAMGVAALRLELRRSPQA